MGWEGMVKTTTPKDHLYGDVLEASKIVASRRVNGTFYIAYRFPDKSATNKVAGVVALCEQHYEDGVCWIDFKVMDETMKPFYYDCPRSILNLLSPTADHNALEWREEQLCNREE